MSEGQDDEYTGIHSTAVDGEQVNFSIVLNLLHVSRLLVVLGGVMTTVLVIWPKVAGFNPGKGRCIFYVRQKSVARLPLDGK
jgi:hypothetical protein